MTGEARAGGGESPPGAPRLYAVIGSPVAHSLSPVLHRAAFREEGVDAAYGALEARPAEVEPLMRALARQGGGNVTLPHKQRAAAALDRPSPAVTATGACNCFWGEGNALAGDNTDVDGFLGAWRGLAEIEPGADVLLLGAGGAARAVLHACERAGARRVDVLNRTTDRAREMVEEVWGRGADVPPPPPTGEARVLEAPDEAGGPYDLVVNATSLGLDPGDRLPLDLQRLEVGSALDLVYGEEETRWVRHARGLEVPAADGLEMLVLQAAASLERWLGGEPPVDRMREAAREALGRPGAQGGSG